jgi:hypothetical protein
MTFFIKSKTNFPGKQPNIAVQFVEDTITFGGQSGITLNITRKLATYEKMDHPV